MGRNHYQLVAIATSPDEKFGFKKEGLKRLAVIRNGKYENEYIMSRILGEE